MAFGLALVTVITPSAAAQDGPILTAEPSNVEAPGDVEFTITATGFTAAPPIAVIPCFGATTPEELAEAGIVACDTGLLTTIDELANGGFTTTITYTVPETGFCIYSGDFLNTETGLPACITVGEATGDGEDNGESADGDSAIDDDDDATLANTGAESALVAVMAFAIVGAGVMVLGYSRRLS